MGSGRVAHHRPIPGFPAHVPPGDVAARRVLGWVLVGDESGSRVYLDHAATAPVLPEAAEAFAREVMRLGNPSSTHGHGRDARRRLEEAREQIAASLGAAPAEVILTAGGCEADTLAVEGGYLAARTAQPERDRVLVSAIEHHAVLEAAHAVGALHGARVAELPVDGEGSLRLDALRDALEDAPGRTSLVSVMWANNEVGTIQPIGEVVRIVREHELAVADSARTSGPTTRDGAGVRARPVVVHSDAVQAVGHVPMDFAASGLDALSLSGHKLGAPIGIGALLARRELALAPVVHGGGQERGVRSGTVPVALAVALAVALEHAVSGLDSERARLTVLREELAAGVLARVPGARVRGAAGAERLPGHVHLTIPGVDVDALLFGLDVAGVSASAGSACQAGVTQASHVLIAMGDDDEAARSVLRLTLGRTSTAADVAAVLAVLPQAVDRARAAGAVAARGRGA